MSVSETTPLRDLGLVGDGDEAEVILALEEAFGVRFGATIERCRTVGDLFAALTRAFPPGEEAGRCASAMAFYRLRRALTAHGFPGVLPPARLGPATLLAEILERGAMSVPALRDNLEIETQLTLPPLAFARLGTIGAVLVILGVLGFFLGWIVGVSWPVAAGFGGVGVLMLYLDPGRFEQATLGDLARSVAIRNAARLIEEGADRRETALWRAFVAVIRSVPDVARGEIAPQTLLLDAATRPSPRGTA